MAEYAILLDSRFCTGCNTCFYKCIQENRLHNVATNGNTRTLVYSNDDGMYHHRCMHCIQPVCVAVCPQEALIKTDYGAVLWDAEACNRCQTCVEECPFGIPMYDEANRAIVKCSMCAHHNYAANKEATPACVGVCPTSALSFGERDAIISQAQELAEKHNLHIYGLKENGGTSFIVLTQEEPSKVGYPVVAEAAFGGGANPLAIGGAVAGAAVVLGGAYLGLKKYAERRDEIENNIKK